MRTIGFSNGTEYTFFCENNCWECAKFNEEEFESDCDVELKLAVGVDELTHEQLQEYFGGKVVEYNSKCLKKEERK